MKKLMLAAALLFSGLSIEAKTMIKDAVNATSAEPKWEKSKAGTWMGAEKTWYKVNPKDASIWWMVCGKIKKENG